ncbi:MAG: hypothetical protein MI864_24490 [Pseudomonadales bacterium]|nr:hypothetical protein [Pseudomonadales bacterium]
MHSVIIFDHLPYSGGYTASLEMVKLLNKNESLIMGPGTERQILGDLSQSELEKLRLISGHTVFGLLESRPVNLNYITMLRNPVNRFISHYFWWQRLVETGDQTEAARCKECDLIKSTSSLEEFLNRYLSITDHFEASQLYYLLHRHIPEKELMEARTLGIFCDEIVDIAVAELEKAYDQVFITELFEESLVAFSWRHNLAFPDVYQKITYSGVKWDELDISKEAIEIITHLCRIESAVYNRARNRFEHEIEPLLDERFINYKVDCIASDSKFLRHYLNQSSTYLPKQLNNGTDIGSKVSDRLTEKIFTALRNQSSMIEPLAYSGNLFDAGNSDLTFMIWGTSEHYRKRYQTSVVNCNNRQFRGFIDNNQEKWGTMIDGYKVHAPQDIVSQENRVDVILIASDFVSEISTQIRKEICYAPLLCH